MWSHIVAAVFLLASAGSAASEAAGHQQGHQLALTPPMGWNSYNYYACSPNQTIIQSNAKALVDLGLDKLGYTYVTTDCGWAQQDRAANGTIQWDPELFPDGFPALGSYIHNLGLKFGLYSDGGVQMCNTGQNDTGSLYHEALDAKTFASWGADSLKYDNCYSDKNLDYPNVSYQPKKSPKSHFRKMSKALAATGRPILFEICDWGVDFPAAWAPEFSSAWRATNDIIPEWKSIYRQVNQIVPQTSYAKPGQWPDLDMLEVGNGFLTTAEEQTHFTLWAMCKSPLVIGTALKDDQTSISQSSLAILANKDVIAINQDPLGMAANLTRRYTEEQYDIWAGKLSNGRTVAALVNWGDAAQSLKLNLPDFGLQYAGSAKDIWANKIVKNIKSSYAATVPAHGTVLLELSSTDAAGYYNATHSAKSTKSYTKFLNIYGITNSALYNLEIFFAQASPKPETIHIKTSPSPAEFSYHMDAHKRTVSGRLSLVAGTSNSITITTTLKITHIQITNPSGVFYPSTSFALSGSAAHTPCAPGTCVPVGAKISSLDPTSSASLAIPRTAATERYVELTYCNNDIAFATSFGDGRNARNITVAVNGHAPVRLEVPLAGRSSELYSPGLGWDDSATLGVLVGGFGGTGKGMDRVVIGNAGGGEGVQPFGADFVGMTVY